jgi:hypothetical protein
MIKKNFKIDGNKEFVYHIEKTCRHCGAPLPENSTAKREFCPKTYDNKGKVRDCKSTYHRLNDKPDRDMFALLIAKVKATHTRIDYMFERIGEEVTTRHLDEYQIKLFDAIETDEKHGLIYFFYLKYVIISNPITQIHKIERHDKYSNNGTIA